MSLATRLKLGTRDLHRQVERSGMMPTFLRGSISRRTYCLLLRNLHAIYSSLEAGLSQHTQTPAIAAIQRQELARSTALEADLVYLHGSDWRTTLPLSAPAQQYSARLQWLAAQAPTQLVAHAYVRYLGDLNGGQVLRRITRRALGLELGLADGGDGGDGTRFHDFGPPGADALAALFRDGLDAIDLPDIELDAIVGEAQRSFAMHQALFEALADA